MAPNGADVSQRLSVHAPLYVSDHPLTLHLHAIPEGITEAPSVTVAWDSAGV